MPGSELWQSLIDLHTRGPNAAGESLNKWESGNDRPIYPSEVALFFEIKCLSGQSDEAVLTARRHIAKSLDPFNAPFIRHLLDFLAGHLKQERLFEFAKTRRDKILYYAFIGFKSLGKGQRDEAIRAFEQIEKMGKLNWAIYEFGFPCRALAYLHRMREDPTWPAWMPPADTK